MNAIASFRKCKLSTPELLEKVDKLTDEMFKKQEVPTRHIPARPDDDYDLLIGELILRVNEQRELIERAHWLVGNPATNISSSTDIACDNWQKDYEAFVTPQSAT
jgi:hypothetical protein